jgi:hypothetical protein
MLGGTSPLSVVLGAAPLAIAETLRLKNYAKALSAQGLAILLIEPGTKKPVDMRSSVQKREDDAAAQAAAKATGRADWAKIKAPAGVHLATSNHTLLGRYIDRYRKVYGDGCPVNFAVAVGPSRLIIVDTDTDEQTAAFLADAGISGETPIPPTVRSPGQRDADGTWAHSGGGHFWFTLPETVTLPDSSGSLTMPGGYAVLWSGRYALIPPSVRPEGAYALAGQDYPVPDWLLSIVTTHVQARAARRAGAKPFGDDLGELAVNIDTWASAVSWADLLESHGWTTAARPDGCGCDVWTAPGVHASPKSATAHDTGCTYGRYSEVNAPLHIWTDNPGPELEQWIRDNGSKTLSKLQVAAAVDYEGDVGTACSQLGLIPKDDLGFDTSTIVADLGMDPSNLDTPLDTPLDEVGGHADRPDDIHTAAAASHRDIGGALGQAAQFAAEHNGEPYSYGGAAAHPQARTNDTDTPEQILTAADSTVPPEPPADPPLFADPGGEPPEDGVLDVGDSSMPRIAWFDYWRDYPAPEFVIEGLIENGGMAAIIGRPGVGKSAVTLDMLCCIATGQPWRGRRVLAQRVMYLPGEGQSGTAERVKAWELARKANVGRDLAMGDSVLKAGAPKDAWQRLIQVILTHRIGVVVFDTFARMAVGIEENSATDVGKVIARLDEVRKLTGCTVILVHHTAKGVGATTARGSSALNGALDTELLVEDGTWPDPDPVVPDPSGVPLQLKVTKQKNAETTNDEHGIRLLMVPFNDSVVITGPSGEVGDVLDETDVCRAIIPETAMATAVRLARELEHFTEQGLTITEAAQAVRADEATARRADAARAWRLALRRAIDLGMRFGLFETLSGTPSGARYIRSDTGIEQFRTEVIAAGLTD